MISPRAKKETYTGNKIILSNDISVYVSGEISEKVFSAIQIFLSGLPLKLTKTTGEADIILNEDIALSDKIERYKISAKGNKITLSFADFMGGRNAAVTLYQLLSFDGATIACLEAEIDDWADNKMRGLLVDPARNFLPADKLKETMLRMAYCKMNVIHLHLMDAESYTLQCTSYPEINDEEFGFYKKDEMRDVVAFGLSIGINCLPEIEAPAHAENLTKKLPFLRCQTETREPSPWVMCVGSEKFYEFFEKIINEIAEIFPYPIVHIGSDEVFFFDTYETYPTWYDCKCCRPLAEKLGIHMTKSADVLKSQKDGTFLDRGIEGLTQMYYYMLKRLHKILADAGKRMMMWNDGIDIGKECDLPRDILIHFWRIARCYRGPMFGCTLAKFVEEGFEVINSHYPQTYVEGGAYYPEVAVGTWAPKVWPEVKSEHRDKIIGGWPAAWFNYPHYEYTLPSVIAFYADRLWDESKGYYGNEFSKDITKLILGPKVPEGFNVFAALGGYFIPRNLPTVPPEEMKFGNLKEVKISKEEVLETEKILRSLENTDTLEGRTAGIYANCVHWVFEQMRG